MSRAIEFSLCPAAQPGIEIDAHTFTPGTVQFASLCEEVTVAINHRHGYLKLNLQPDEARALANQLLKVAAICDTHRGNTLARAAA